MSPHVRNVHQWVRPGPQYQQFLRLARQQALQGICRNSKGAKALVSRQTNWSDILTGFCDDGCHCYHSKASSVQLHRLAPLASDIQQRSARNSMPVAVIDIESSSDNGWFSFGFPFKQNNQNESLHLEKFPHCPCQPLLFGCRQEVLPCKRPTVRRETFTSNSGPAGLMRFQSCLYTNLPEML